MATVVLDTPAQESAAMIRGQLTSLKKNAQAVLANIVNVARQQGRKPIDEAFGTEAAAFAEDVERVRALLAGFGVAGVPALPE